MKGSAGALLGTGENPTIAYGRGAAAARTLAAARAAPRTMDDGAETRLLRRLWLLAMTPRQFGRSGRDGLGVVEKAAVWGAARTGRQAFVRERSGDVALAAAHSGLGQGPVDDIALRVAAADLP